MDGSVRLFSYSDFGQCQPTLRSVRTRSIILRRRPDEFPELLDAGQRQERPVFRLGVRPPAGQEKTQPLFP